MPKLHESPRQIQFGAFHVLQTVLSTTGYKRYGKQTLRIFQYMFKRTCD